MALTVTAAVSTPANAGVFLQVQVMTGAAATQNGATKTAHTSGAADASITTTTTVSYVLGALAVDESSSTSLVMAAGTTKIAQAYDSGAQVVFCGVRTTSVTGTPGAATVGSTTV